MWIKEQLDLFGSLSLAFLIGEILLRALKVFREYKYFKPNYVPENRLKTIIQRALAFNTPSYLFAMGTVWILASCASVDWNWVLTGALVYIIVYTIKLQESEFDLVEWVRQPRGLDYAEGMAHSYFHGYLKLAISARERTDDNIQERMKKYTASQNVTFAKECLFVLIPDDMFCPPVIKSSILEKARPLETVVLDRAGVERPYKNDVYRFVEPILGKKYYIAVEGATPIQTFYEAMENNFTSTNQMTKMKRELLLKFYKTLKNLVEECHEMAGLVDVVLYHNKKGCQVDVGEVLKARIENYLTKKNPLNRALNGIRENYQDMRLAHGE